MSNTFNTRQEIINALVEQWDENPKSFNNTSTNKQIEKFWTYNRLLKHYYELKQDWSRTEHGRTRHSIHGIPMSEMKTAY
jgi:hypothetical protein